MTRKRCTRCCALLLVFCCCAALFSPATCMAGERTYLVTEAELTRLEMNLTRQEAIIGRLSEELTALQLNETEAQKALSEALQSLQIMKNELARLQTALTASETSRRKANQLLEEYEIEMKRKAGRLKTQRTVWQAAAGLLLGRAIWRWAA